MNVILGITFKYKIKYQTLTVCPHASNIYFSFNSILIRNKQQALRKLQVCSPPKGKMHNCLISVNDMCRCAKICYLKDQVWLLSVSEDFS